MWGGFEGATHRRTDGVRVDAIAASGHDRWARLDLAILRSLGIRTAREALRWHLIARSGSGHDWTSARAQMEAAVAADVGVVWDLCHWGLPDGMDVMHPDWPQRLADFAVAAAQEMRHAGVRVEGWVPVNEIAFWSWAGGETAGFAPYLSGQGGALKRQLVLGHLAAVSALRSAGSLEAILVCEPLIRVAPADPGRAAQAAAYIDAAFEAVSAILDADASAIDIIGLNFYPQNQWCSSGVKILRGDPAWVPLRDLLQNAARRFPKPLLLAETGAEEPQGDDWLRYVGDEVVAARSAGVPLDAICVYPIMDYAGWDDARHCACGPIGHRKGQRFVRPGQARAVADLALCLLD